MLRARALPSGGHALFVAHYSFATRPKLPRYKSAWQGWFAAACAAHALIKTELRDASRILAADERALDLADQLLLEQVPAERVPFFTHRARRYYRLLRGGGNPWRDCAA